MGRSVTLLQISVDEELLASAGVDPAKAGKEFRVLAAAKLFELRRITLGQASRLAGLSLCGGSFTLGVYRCIAGARHFLVQSERRADGT